MITKLETLLDVLGTPNTQLVIPVYQRVYAWTEAQCNTLWEDVLQAGRTGSPHFVGTILYSVEEGDARNMDVVDGQQRLATVSLLIAALRDYLAGEGKRLSDMGPGDLSRRYLEASVADGALTFSTCKLVLSRFDRETMSAVVHGTELPCEERLSKNVLSNYQMFRDRMDGLRDVGALWRGLSLLTVISAAMEEGDRPQLVFESLNSKGRPLTTADLVRNLLLANVGLEEQARLYERYWAPIEALFAGDLDSTQFAAALRAWVAIKAPKAGSCGSDDVYASFKAYVESEHAGSLEELLMGLKGFCESFVVRTQSTGAQIAASHNTYGVAKVEGIISEKKLFGD